MNQSVRSRYYWVKLYEKKQDAGFVCRRCGISRPTLRKWYKRYKEKGVEGLRGLSRRPKSSPKTKVTKDLESKILDLRTNRRLGARRIQSELLKHQEISLSLSTIHKVLVRHQVKPLKKSRRKKQFKRYSRPIPGDRVQIDTMKVANGIIQYTSVDDCSRYRVLGIYKRKTAANSIDFMERVLEEMPFPIQRVQTDRGTEFFALKFQKYLKKNSIKFRPIKPRSPYLNGKVERSQRTDVEEFYSVIDLKSEDLSEQLDEWQFFYNWHRPHGSLKSKSPIDIVCELGNKTPLWADVYEGYDASKENLREQNYQDDLKLQELFRQNQKRAISDEQI